MRLERQTTVQEPDEDAGASAPRLLHGTALLTRPPAVVKAFDVNVRDVAALSAERGIADATSEYTHTVVDAERDARCDDVRQKRRRDMRDAKAEEERDANLAERSAACDSEYALGPVEEPAGDRQP